MYSEFNKLTKTINAYLYPDQPQKIQTLHLFKLQGVWFLSEWFISQGSLRQPS